ncbi:hypothetical protein HYN69_02875 [Gemmobacter aquarius]|uniref:Uncharacterized protein n=1 Tax=Paragemmobacter aquarius TaxID=2169400 RepID=A0A2S0UIC8_9RHOB|nr:hypothetical protein [Gemmobacter aquarius]AWB47588.1 hypothetical protein HYN69_02875 [Gemmobacter aquarius]
MYTEIQTQLFLSAIPAVAQAARSGQFSEKDLVRIEAFLSGPVGQTWAGRTVSAFGRCASGPSVPTTEHFERYRHFVHPLYAAHLHCVEYWEGWILPERSDELLPNAWNCEPISGSIIDLAGHDKARTVYVGMRIPFETALFAILQFGEHRALDCDDPKARELVAWGCGLPVTAAF